ncbi:MAG: pyridoxal phosphate-dependent aminotransferase [Duodenibacillus sp.]|nr:pyridoxal phosphate-dependent aminotransferase [Duodenibacillus sp.]
MQHNFDEYVDRRGTDSSKWLKYPADVLPFWVADGEFKCPQPMVEAMKRIAEHGIYGYPWIHNGAFERATVGWCGRRFGWEITEDMVTFVPDLGTALAVAVKAFASAPGSKVLMQTPIYPPFRAVTLGNDVTPSCNSLKLVNGRYEIDFEDFEARCADPAARLFLLCNPHNPTGRVFTREELERMVDICVRHGVMIFSDEVHADLVYAPNKHIALPTLSDLARDNCLVGLNPSKTFNNAGCRTASVVCHSPEVRKAYQKALASCKLGRNIWGVTAYISAYTECDYYADQVNAYLKANMEYAVAYIQANIPGIKAYMPEATYLLWLDCRALGFATQEELDDYFVDVAKVGLNPGESFGVEGRGFLRMNLACPRAMLQQGLERMAAACARLGK